MPTLTVNDLTINYAERGEGPSVLTLHAATATGAMMGWLARHIANLGYRVVMPDQRGHGKTPNPASDLHMPRLTGDILEFIHALGISPLHGMGYSMGGGVILHAAQRHPDMFRSLLLMGTAYNGAGHQRILDVLGPLERRPEIEQAVFDPQTGIGVGWDHPAEFFSNIACPVLIIAADRDEFNDVEASLTFYRALPNARLLVVPDCDHLGLVRHPILMEAVKEFYSHVR